MVAKGGMLKKLDNKGFDAMFLGYSDEHANGVCRMMNLNTRKISITRDVKWLNKMHYDHLHGNKVDKSEQDSYTSLGVEKKVSATKSASLQNQIA